MSLTVNSIILAAGLSRRMGEANKLTIDVDGQPLARRTVCQYMPLSRSVTVVLGFDAETIENILSDLGVSSVINPDYEKGRQSSSAYGLQNTDIDGDAVLIGLADQYNIRTEDINELIEYYRSQSEEKIIIPKVGSERGNPILFPASLARKMKENKRAPACRKFIDENPDKILWMETDNPRFLQDLDTPNDVKMAGLTFN